MKALGDFLSHGKVQMEYRLEKKKGNRGRVKNNRQKGGKTKEFPQKINILDAVREEEKGGLSKQKRSYYTSSHSVEDMPACRRISLAGLHQCHYNEG
jgi:hypothetical protein